MQKVDRGFPNQDFTSPTVIDGQISAGPKFCAFILCDIVRKLLDMANASSLDVIIPLDIAIAMLKFGLAGYRDRATSDRRRC
jgi:hypothetical protein